MKGFEAECAVLVSGWSVMKPGIPMLSTCMVGLVII